VLTAAFTGLTWLVYRRIKAVMEETNWISARSLEEQRRAREQEYLPILNIEVTSQPQRAGESRKLLVTITNFGRGPALFASCVEPEAPEPEKFVGPREDGPAKTHFHPSFDADLRSLRTVRVRYQDLLGGKWEARLSLLERELRAVRLDQSERW